MAVTGIHLLYTPASGERSQALAEAAMIVRPTPERISIQAIEYDNGEIIAFDGLEADSIRRESPLVITIERDHDALWRLTMSSSQGVVLLHLRSSSMMLSELIDFLGAHGAGNFMVVNYDTGEVL